MYLFNEYAACALGDIRTSNEFSVPIIYLLRSFSSASILAT